jgi:hypothetical protein
MHVVRAEKGASKATSKTSDNSNKVLDMRKLVPTMSVKAALPRL